VRRILLLYEQYLSKIGTRRPPTWHARAASRTLASVRACAAAAGAAPPPPAMTTPVAGYAIRVRATPDTEFRMPLARPAGPGAVGTREYGRMYRLS
jgi:hypothetical protein